MITELRKEIDSVFGMVDYLCKSMSRHAEALADKLPGTIKNVVVTGCGDSYCASVAAQKCFETVAGLHTDAPTCLDAARHYDLRRMGEPGETVMLLVSFSGKVSRVVEAAQRARKHGVITVAVTHDAASPVAEACDLLLHVEPDAYELKRTPGCRTYMASTLSLLLFAIFLGKKRGVIADTGPFLDAVLADKAAWQAVFPEIDARLRKMAQDWAGVPYFEALGAGSEFATAWFAQAKIYEATGDFARYENFEDWAHVDYILRKMDSGMFLYVTQDNPSLSRAMEVESVLDRQNYRYCVVTDKNPETWRRPQNVLRVPASPYQWLNPVMQTLVPCAFADYLMQEKDTHYFCSDMIESWFPFGGSILRNSAIDDSF